MGKPDAVTRSSGAAGTATRPAVWRLGVGVIEDSSVETSGNVAWTGLGMVGASSKTGVTEPVRRRGGATGVFSSKGTITSRGKMSRKRPSCQAVTSGRRSAASLPLTIVFVISPRR